MKKAVYIFISFLMISCSSSKNVANADVTRYKCIKENDAFKRHGTFSSVKAKIAFYKASVKARKISKEYYPNLKYSNTRRDAYRHVLWSALLSKHFSSSSIKNRINYSKAIGEANEKCGDNSIEDSEMDDHNNKFGINLFTQSSSYSKFLGFTLGVKKSTLKNLKKLVFEKVEEGLYIEKDSLKKSTYENIKRVSESKVVFLEE